MALNASDVLYAMYPEAGRIEWLGQIDLMLGYAHGSFPRTVEAWADSIHPEETEKIIALYTRACEEGEEFQVEYRMRHRNGSYRDWSHRGKPVYGTNKKLLKLVGACTRAL
jgi:PAS domain-containing protein